MEIESVERLDHLGIIAGTIDDLGLVELLDGALGSGFDGENITIGETIKGLIINGLGFSDRPISLLPQFFEQIPLKRLFQSSPNVKCSDFNRHKIGRVLDRIYDKGCSLLFSKAASHAAKVEGIATDRCHLDTSTFSVTGGGYESTDENAIEVTHGYSKDHRPDLRQIVQELLVTNDGGIPLISKSFSGNTSDTKIFEQRSSALVQAIREGSWEGTLVADAKLYTKTNAASLYQLTFITRIPHSIGEAKKLIASACNDSSQAWQQLDKRHFKVYPVTHYGMEQRWLVVYSEESRERARNTMRKRINKERERIDKELFHLQAQRFHCENDALTALQVWEKKWKYHRRSQDPKIHTYARYAKRGKPAPGAVPDRFEYKIEGFCCEDAEAIEMATQESACYILGSNATKEKLDDPDIITSYSDQHVVERGFRFFKEPIFFVSSLFLKKPERIEALLMIMSLSLLVYSIAERHLRRAMAKVDATIPNQIDQPTKRPTLRWVFQCLLGVNVVKLKQGTNNTQELMNGMNDLRKKIISFFGPGVGRIYAVS